MGFFKSVFKAIENSVKTISNPQKMLSMKEDLLRPGGSLTLDDFFKRVDPILDTASPLHNVIQEKTTGSATTEGQSPYFQAIAPVIVDVFFPGAGSMAAGISNISDGNTGKGIAQFAGGYVSQVGSAYSAIGQAGNLAGVASAVKIGSTAWAIYDSKDQLRGYYGTGAGMPVNMVSQTQQQAGISLNNPSGGVWSKFTNTGDTTHEAVDKMIMEQKLKDQNSALLLLGAVAGYFLLRN